MTSQTQSSQDPSNPPLQDCSGSQTAGGPLPQLSGYDAGRYFDELVTSDNVARADAALLVQLINQMGVVELGRRQAAIERALYRMGITFTVYGDSQGTEKIMPFDVVPRIVSAMLWQRIDAGLKQRIRALNRFLDDVYNDRNIINDGVVPADLVDSAKAYLPQCKGLKPPQGVWCHVTGTDLVRDNAGNVFVLEDNLRCPSGVSYVLQNRHVMKRNFPQVFRASRVRPVADYPARLYDMLKSVAPGRRNDPVVVVLTPGVFNSAYYEHSFLAQQMGVQLVEGRDLTIEKDKVYMRTTAGLTQVDVIYRRVDDTFIDPDVFNADSMLGVAGLMRAYQAGNVTLANAPGTGVADDKVVYAFVPKMIEYYLGEKAILPNVSTYLCSRDDDRQYVLDHLDELVVKAAAESGGYGIMIGPHASEAEREEFAKNIRENPRNWIAQPTLQLSRVPTIVGDQISGRHVDLRPYILCSGQDDVWVLPGGLTRVALREGSLVVNSSQGGGSKDTWVAAVGDQQVATN
jgi:uncharacterized circularly permuted ATP-grasp superfamily protein